MQVVVDLRSVSAVVDLGLSFCFYSFRSELIVSKIVMILFLIEGNIVFFLSLFFFSPKALETILFFLPLYMKYN